MPARPPLCLSPAYAPFVLAAGRKEGPLRARLAPERGREVVSTRHYRLLWCERGGAMVEVDRQRLRAGEGALILLVPGGTGVLHVPAATRIRTLLFDVVPGSRRRGPGQVWQDGPHVQPTPERVWGVALPALVPAPACASGRAMLARVQAVYWRSAIHQLAANASLAAWLAELALLRQEADPGRDPPVEDPMLARAIAAARTGAANGMRTSDLASEVGLSRSQIARRCRRSGLMPPGEMLAELRMEAALRLLEEPGAPIAAVAARAGYGSAASFCRAFRRRFGAPPGRWRRGGRT